MTRSLILTSFLLPAALYAARVADKSTEHESQSFGHASAYAPGEFLLTFPHASVSAAMPGGTATFRWTSPPGVVGRALSPRMSMQDPGYRADVPNDWKSDLRKVWDEEEQQYKTRDVNGKWRDARGRFTSQPNELASDSPPAAPESDAAQRELQPEKGHLAWVEERLRAAMLVEHLDIVDVFDGHTVEAFAAGSKRAIDPHGLELQLTIVSPAFDGQKLVERHRMVTNALWPELMSGAIHSLPKMKALTPAQWQSAIATESGEDSTSHEDSRFDNTYLGS